MYVHTPARVHVFDIARTQLCRERHLCVSPDTRSIPFSLSSIPSFLGSPDAKASPSLSVTDGRGVSQTVTLYTGGPATRSPASCSLGSTCAIPLVVIATFVDPMVALTTSSLVVAKLGGGFGTVNSVQSSAGGRMYTFSVTLGPGIAGGEQYTVSIPAGASSTLSSAYLSGASSAVSIVVDVVAPVPGGGDFILTSPQAAVGVPYAYNFSTSFFSDAVSAPSALLLASSIPASNIGLNFVPGKQGLAQIVGAAFQYPVTGQVTYAVTAFDEAGNSAVRNIIVGIAPAIVDLVLSFATTPLVFVEASGALSIDAFSTFAWTSNVDALSVTLVGSEADSGAPTFYTERVAAVTPAGMTLTPWVYDTASSSGTLSWACTSPSCLGPVGVTTFLQSIAYSNTFLNFPAGGRRVQVRGVLCVL